MSTQLEPHYTNSAGNPVGAIVSNFVGEAIIVAGDSVPSDAGLGYGEGCLFFKNSGAEDAQVYINLGTGASCNFDPLITSALVGNTAGAPAAGDAVILSSTGSVTFPAGTAGTTEVAIDGNSLAAPGAGTAGTGTVLKTSVLKCGGIIHTQILIDLTGLNGGGTAGDVIGVNGAGAAYLCQITAAKNGTILGGRMSCLETPVGSNVDVDLWSANEATGVEDTAISALTGEVQLINHGDWAAGEIAGLVADPVADQYLYLTSGAATDAAFTAGRFLIEFFGYDA